jgi:hypothetical protein
MVDWYGPRHRRHRHAGTAPVVAFLAAVALAIGCERGSADVASPSSPVDLFAYPVPAEGVSVQRLVEDAKRLLGKNITCSETALADTRPIRIVGLHRAPNAEALRVFQSLFLTNRLRLFELEDQESGLFLETLDSSGRSIRGGGFYWIDDVASQEVHHPIKVVILLRHARAYDLRATVVPLFNPRDARFEELIAPEGWLVEAPPATIKCWKRSASSTSLRRTPTRPAGHRADPQRVQSCRAVHVVNSKGASWRGANGRAPILRFPDRCPECWFLEVSHSGNLCAVQFFDAGHFALGSEGKRTPRSFSGDRQPQRGRPAPRACDQREQAPEATAFAAGEPPS